MTCINCSCTMTAHPYAAQQQWWCSRCGGGDEAAQPPRINVSLVTILAAMMLQAEYRDEADTLAMLRQF